MPSSTEQSADTRAMPLPAALAPLPRPLTSFVGRESEPAAIEALLDEEGARLVTLTGPGGVGKTRIALRVAERFRERGRDVLFVPLEAVRDPALVLPAIAERLLPLASAEERVAEQMGAYLGDRRLLLVLDNVEQVVDAAPDLAQVLQWCPRLAMLVTSRVRLDLAGERAFPIPPLPLPARVPDGDLAALSAVAAVRLFVQRGQAAQPGFALTAANAETVAAICHRLDGLPLAIELAAARLRLLTPDALRTRLDQRLPLLTGGARDLPQRQRTIRDTIAWSHDLLSPAEQRFFRQMTVFVGGFTLDAAEAIMPPTDGCEAMTMIETLVDHSLVRFQPGDGDPRYVMLETVREYGLEQLTATGEEASARLAHARYLMKLTEDAYPELAMIGRFEPVIRIDAELGNLRAALDWLDQSGRTDDLLQLANHLQWTWYMVSPAEGVRWYERILRRGFPEDDPTAMNLLRWAGLLLITIAPESEPGRSYLERARDLARAAGNGMAEAEATLFLGIRAEDTGDPVTAAACLADARRWYEQADDQLTLALIDYHRGIVAYGRGQLSAAAALLDKARAAAIGAGNRRIANWCGVYLALVACALNDPARAASELRAQRAGMDRDGVGPQARIRSATAVLAAAIGDDDTAARLLGALKAARRVTGLGWPENVTADRVAASMRARLGDEAFEAAALAGRNLSEAEVMALIDRLLESSTSAPPVHRANAFPITPREREVLRLVAEGKSDREIGAILFLSHRTVENHVIRILARLGVSSRAAAAAYAIREGLI